MAKWVLRPWRRRTRAHALILLYHRIAAPRSDPWKLCVIAGELPGSPRVLQRHCEFVPLAAIPERLAQPIGRAAARRWRSRSTTVTWTTFTKRLPALQAVDAPATVFLATGWIGEPAGLLVGSAGRSIVLDSGRLPDRFDLPIGAVDFAWARRAAGTYERGTTERDCIASCGQRFQDASRRTSVRPTLARLGDVFGVTARHDAAARPMTADEVREMHASGLMSIGAHTRHASPAAGPGSGRAATRDRGFTAGLPGDLTGVLPTCFAYPYGEVTEMSPQLAGARGSRWRARRSRNSPGTAVIRSCCRGYRSAI